VTRGRPPVALRVRPEVGYVVGLKLSDQTQTAVILDMAGNRIADASLPNATPFQSFASALETAEAVLNKALTTAGLTQADLLGVGLGIAGLVDHQSGMVSWSPLISERNLPIAAALQDRIGCPVSVDNDANLVTLAELWFGVGRTQSDFAVVTVEHGVGMGLVLNHQLYRGTMGLGMELGHTKVQLDGALCRCGRRGCLEAYVADYALVREASTAMNWGHSELTAPKQLLQGLYDQAKAGDETAQSIFNRAGRYLALGLANIVNIFDPSLILLSGERLQSGYLYSQDVLAEVNALALDTGRAPVRVEIQSWGDLLWAQGAAALALDVATHSIFANASAP